MGSGGTTALLPPGKFCFIRPLLRSDLICIRLKIFSHPPKQPSLHACRSTLEDELACFVNQMINNPLYQSQRFCHSYLGEVVARMSLQKAER